MRTDDKRRRQGIYVLNTVYISSNDTIDSVALSVRAVMHHPSILMWVVGNEWLGGGPAMPARLQCGGVVRYGKEVVGEVRGEAI